MRKIFISYRRDDSVQMTERIYEKLIEEYGSKSIFKDVDNIPIGVDFRKALEEEVQKCDIVLVIIGKKWLTVTNEKGELRLFDKNDFVRIEVDMSLKRGILVIPILVDGSVVPKEDDLPDSLNRLPYLNALQIRTHPDTKNDMRRLIKSIDKSIFPYKNIIKYTKIVAVVFSLSFLGYSQYNNVMSFFKSHLKVSLQDIQTEYEWRYKKNGKGEKDGIVVASYWDTDKIVIEGLYKNDKKEGDFIKYDKNGIKIEKIVYINDKQVYQEIYFDNGKIKNKKYLLTDEYYKNGNIRLETKYVYNSEYDLEVTIFDKNKNIIRKNSYNNGELTKIIKYQDGVEKEIFYYKGTNNEVVEFLKKNGKLVGYTLYDKDTGEIIDKDTIEVINKDKLDSYEYIWEYYSSGKLKNFYKKYKDGEKDGKYKEFYQDGQLKYEKDYRNGKLEGEYKEYSKDGRLKQEGVYVDEQKEIYAEYE